MGGGGGCRGGVCGFFEAEDGRRVAGRTGTGDRSSDGWSSGGRERGWRDRAREWRVGLGCQPDTFAQLCMIQLYFMLPKRTNFFVTLKSASSFLQKK